MCGQPSAALELLRLKLARMIYAGASREAPLISIVIATYNRGKILCERTLPAILDQTYKKLEVIVVGDCVADKTAELISQIRDTRLRFIDLPVRTEYPPDPIDRWMVAGAKPRNVALSMAKGDWIYVISDDDILLPHCLERMVEFAVANSDVESVSASYLSYVDGKEKKFTAKDVQKQLGIYMTGIPAWMYRSYLSFFEWNINSWKKSWNRPSDYDLQHRMHNSGVRMGYFDEVIAISPLVEGTQVTGSKAAIYLSQQNG
jgi:glycosyltransferase involved in cell wall biosynthesis